MSWTSCYYYSSFGLHQKLSKYPKVRSEEQEDKIKEIINCSSGLVVSSFVASDCYLVGNKNMTNQMLSLS